MHASNQTPESNLKKTFKSFFAFQKKRVLFACGAAILFLPAAVRADTVRAAVGLPLQRAEALIRAHNDRAALVELQQASKAGGLTAYERTAIAQLHGMAEAGDGNYAQAAVDYRSVLAAPTTPPTERLEFTQAIAGFYFAAADYPQTIIWVNRYIAAGGTDAPTRALLPQAYFQKGNYAGAEQAVQRDERNGAVLPEAELQLLAYSAQKSGDRAGYFAALLALLKTYPSSESWNAAITVVAGLPDFPDALTLDLYRLRRATHTLTAPGDYEDYTERAILAGQPQEAKSVINEGFSGGILQPATDNGHAGRLQRLADSDAAPAPAEPAPEDPLRTGISDFQAGQLKHAATDFQNLADTLGSGPLADLARLWAIYAQHAARVS